MRPALREEDFNLEKNVIKEEIAMYEDHPPQYVFEKCRSLYFRDHPCGFSVLGSNESITNLTAEQMRSYFNRRYVPNNIVLACAGNFDWEQFCELAQEQCNGWQPMTAGRKTEFFSGSGEKQRIEKTNIVREHICLMSPSVSVQDDRKFAAGLLATIAGDDTGSRFFWELVDTAVAETAAMNSENMDGVGAFYSYISCDPQNAAKAMDIVRKIFKDLAKNGITDEELQNAKNKILSSLTLKNELPMGRLTELGFNWVYLQKYRSIEDDIRQVRAVSKTDVNKIIEEFNPLNFTELAMGPGGTE
jgi:predicted Zn-dependent peptidase